MLNRYETHALLALKRAPGTHHTVALRLFPDAGNEDLMCRRLIGRALKKLVVWGFATKHWDTCYYITEAGVKRGNEIEAAAARRAVQVQADPRGDLARGGLSEAPGSPASAL